MTQKSSTLDDLKGSLCTIGITECIITLLCQSCSIKLMAKRYVVGCRGPRPCNTEAPEEYDRQTDRQTNKLFAHHSKIA